MIVGFLRLASIHRTLYVKNVHFALYEKKKLLEPFLTSNPSELMSLRFFTVLSPITVFPKGAALSGC